MTPRSLRSLALAASLATGLAAVPAQAQQAVPTDGPAPFTTPVVPETALGTVAGREDTRQVALANQQAGVAGNSVGDHSTTGDATIADNAFQNMSGLSILNVNTGNNVAINAAMNVTISVAPGQ